MQTFLFYDIETTGLSKSFDQVLHFAAIRTDCELKELERYELKIKLNADVIPSPAALITHQLGLQEIASGITEFEAIKQIHQWLNQPATISLGYNSLRFDDEFLRFSFYRNLLPPYTHQYANQCSRMDLYPMAVMYFLFKKSVITWPEIAGKSSFKLELLNQVNQLAAGRAHHAMVDVEATLALARHFFKEREMWDYLTGYFNKEIEQERLRGLQTTPALMIDGSLGTEKMYQCPVLFLGMHRHYKNQMLWLPLDREEFTSITPQTIPTLAVMHKKIGEPSFILPSKARFSMHLTPARQALAAHNHQWLAQHPDVFSQLLEYHAEYKYPVYPNTDVTASLYLNGFWKPEEEKFCRLFHHADPQQKAKLTAQLKASPLQMLALRILGRHFPDTLTSQQTEQFAEYMQKTRSNGETEILIDYQGKKRLTAQAALHEIIELRKKLDLTNLQLELLAELENYLH
jgi:exodeoxyribonuclease-1